MSLHIAIHLAIAHVNRALARTTNRALGLIVLSLLAAGCASRSNSSVLWDRFDYAQPHMGVPFRIVLYATNATAARHAAEAAFHRIAALNQILSDYETDSELSRLSQSSGRGQFVPLSDDLWRVLDRAQAMARQTRGAFDPTVGPCAGLWRKARRVQAMPESRYLTDALSRVGYTNLHLRSADRSAMLQQRDMLLDLGGIAKGYALDEAMLVLHAHGVPAALISGGGDIVAGDPPPGRPGWRIEIAPLDAPGAPPSRDVLLRNAALATSGDLFQHVVIDGVRYSHIVDPRTCLGLTDHSLVTIIARDGITADSLATAVSVLGPEAGLDLVESTPGAAAYLVRQPAGRLQRHESERFGGFWAEH